VSSRVRFGRWCADYYFVGALYALIDDLFASVRVERAVKGIA
jgi:hypothetical protein